MVLIMEEIVGLCGCVTKWYDLSGIVIGSCRREMCIEADEEFVDGSIGECITSVY